LLSPLPFLSGLHPVIHTTGSASVDRIALGGSYYLPYRLHATREQMRSAYPRLDEFVAAKRRTDPQLRFRNALWDTYLA
jgi:FAD/FMN-containing dehydrogenase